MGLFRGSPQSKAPTAPPQPPPPPPVVHPPSTLRLDDRPYRMPDLDRWRGALVHGLHDLMDEELEELEDPVLLDHLLYGFADKLPAADVDRWVEGTGSYFALVVRAATTVQSAWALQSGGRGVPTGEEAWQIFREKAAAAETDLKAATELDPTRPYAWGQAVASGRASQRPIADIEDRYRKAIAGGHFLSASGDQMLLATSARWGGTHEAMFEFARDTVVEAPEGHPVHAVAAAAVVERRVGCSSWDEWVAVRDGTPAIGQLLAAAAARSVDLQGFDDDSPMALQARNTFAAAFGLMPDLDRLRLELDRIGKHVGTRPWDLVGGTAGVTRLRTLVGLP